MRNTACLVTLSSPLGYPRPPYQGLARCQGVAGDELGFGGLTTCVACHEVCETRREGHAGSRAGSRACHWPGSISCTYLSIDLSICLSIDERIYILYICIQISIHLSICLSLYLYLYIYIFTSFLPLYTFISISIYRYTCFILLS